MKKPVLNLKFKLHVLIKRYCAICIFDIYNWLSMTYEKSCITFLQAFLSIIKCIPMSQK